MTLRARVFHDFARAETKERKGEKAGTFKQRVKFNFGKAIRARVSRLQFTAHERITPLLWILRIRRAPPYRVANRNQKPYQPSGPARNQRLFAITVGWWFIFGEALMPPLSDGESFKFVSRSLIARLMARIESSCLLGIRFGVVILSKK